MTGRGKPALWRWWTSSTTYGYHVGEPEGLSLFSPERCYVVVTALAREPLHAITEAAAVREGVANVEAYRALWISINGAASWNANPDCWIIRFEYQE